MFSNQASEKSTVDSAGNVVTSGDREKRACVIVETDGIVIARSLMYLLPEPHHPIGAVVEPRRRPKAQAGIVSGQRLQFPAVGRFVEREQNDGKPRLVSKPC